MKQRPWIWIVIGFLLFVVALGHFVQTAIRNAQQEVPLTHGR
jgi:hypothetical protein